jgi:hypothetical protein
MPKTKKPWITPRLERLEPTEELLDLFAGKYRDRRRPPDLHRKRAG